MDFDCFTYLNALIRDRQVENFDSADIAVTKMDQQQDVEPATEKPQPQKNQEELFNRYAGELMVLAQDNPELAAAIEEKKPYSYELTLEKIFQLLPKSKRSCDRYAGLQKYLKGIGVELIITSTRPAKKKEGDSTES